MKTERVQDQKDKMQAELQALWKEQCDQLRKKKEQFATEVGKIQLTPLKWGKKDIKPKGDSHGDKLRLLFACMFPLNIRTNVVMCCQAAAVTDFKSEFTQIHLKKPSNLNCFLSVRT